MFIYVHEENDYEKWTYNISNIRIVNYNHGASP